MSSETAPKISVIVPNYNYARYLRARMNSIFCQTYRDFEIILLDDASTDGSQDLIEQYLAHPAVSQVFVNKNNSGSPFLQWMKGIQAARGEYIWIAEADDMADFDFLSYCMEKIEGNPHVAFCYCGSRLIDEDGNQIYKDPNRWGRRYSRDAALFEGKVFLRRNLYWRNYVINASAVLFRRDMALKLAGSAFLEMRYCGDWLFWAQMAEQGQVIEMYHLLNSFRQHTGKTTVRSHETGGGLLEDIMVVKEIERMVGNIDDYRRRLRRGLLYRKIFRDIKSDEVRKAVIKTLYETLGSSKADHYLELCNRFLRLINPSLPTARRDRL